MNDTGDMEQILTNAAVDQIEHRVAPALFLAVARREHDVDRAPLRKRPRPDLVAPADLDRSGRGRRGLSGAWRQTEAEQPSRVGD